MGQSLSQNPYEDPMGWRSGYSTPKGEKRPWGNGDGRFVYPPEAAADAHPSGPVLDGPVDSIRWEMLRDGIEDYEYLVILRGLLKDKKLELSTTYFLPVSLAGNKNGYLCAIQLFFFKAFGYVVKDQKNGK